LAAQLLGPGATLASQLKEKATGSEDEDASASAEPNTSEAGLESAPAESNTPEAGVESTPAASNTSES